MNFLLTSLHSSCSPEQFKSNTQAQPSRSGMDFQFPRQTESLCFYAVVSLLHWAVCFSVLLSKNQVRKKKPKPRYLGEEDNWEETTSKEVSWGRIMPQKKESRLESGDTVHYATSGKILCPHLKGRGGPHLLGLQRLFCAETGELQTLRKLPGRAGALNICLPSQPSFHSRPSSCFLLLLSCKTDRLAKLHNTEDACDTQKMSRGNSKELYWIS